MTKNKVLTFELTPNSELLEIYCNKEGLEHFIHSLNGLIPKNRAIPDHDHWMADSIAGCDLTADKQGRANTLYEMVTAHYVPPYKEPDSHPAGRLLTFLAGEPGGECQIFGDAAGVHRLIDRLQMLAGGDLTRPFSDVWTNSAPEGGILTDENWAKHGTLVKQVTLHYRPRTDAA